MVADACDAPDVSGRTVGREARPGTARDRIGAAALRETSRLRLPPAGTIDSPRWRESCASAISRIPELVEPLAVLFVRLERRASRRHEAALRVAGERRRQQRAHLSQLLGLGR